MPNQNDIDKITNSQLKDTDTFRFECKMCGRCCTRRPEDVFAITGYDIYRMAKHLDMSTDDFIATYCNSHIGSNSHLVVYSLKQDENHRCSLLKDNKCSVHEAKPVVCAVFPLGRATSINRETGEVETIYFNPTENRCAATRTKVTHTLKEWKEMFHLEESQNAAKQWAKLSELAYRLLGTCKDFKSLLLMRAFTAGLLYSYDTSRPCEEQMQEHIKQAEKMLRNAQ